MKNFKFWLFTKLLKWFTTEELDQWSLLKVSTPYGKVYVTISRELIDGFKDDHFSEIA